MNANELFKGLRRIRSRVNHSDFVKHFYGNRSINEDYLMEQWVMFRDDLISFWCYSDNTRQALVESLVERHAAKEKQAEELRSVIDEVGI
tara:strand:+ start:563 stop:832 length:270 start_codon:yes stop_codon:yes gene_type:complete